jgi:hypothetical protein
MGELYQLVHDGMAHRGFVHQGRGPGQGVCESGAGRGIMDGELLQAYINRISTNERVS